MHPKSKKQSAFSLVEIVVVVAVLFIIASIAIPHITKTFREARISTAQLNAQRISSVSGAADAAGVIFNTDGDLKNTIKRIIAGSQNLPAGEQGVLADTNFHVPFLNDKQIDDAIPYLGFDKYGVLRYLPDQSPINVGLPGSTGGSSFSSSATAVGSGGGSVISPPSSRPDSPFYPPTLSSSSASGSSSSGLTSASGGSGFTTSGGFTGASASGGAASGLSSSGGTWPGSSSASASSMTSSTGGSGHVGTGGTSASGSGGQGSSSGLASTGGHVGTGGSTASGSGGQGSSTGWTGGSSSGGSAISGNSSGSSSTATGQASSSGGSSSGTSGSGSAGGSGAGGPANSAPIPEPDFYEKKRGYSGLLDVLINDSDPDGDRLSISSLTKPIYGEVSIQNNQIYYESKTNAGFDAFTYRLSDGKLKSEFVPVNISFKPNSPPAAEDDEGTFSRDVLQPVDLLSNDTDEDGDNLVVTHLFNGEEWIGVDGGATTTLTVSNGELTLANGKLSFSPGVNDGTNNGDNSNDNSINNGQKSIEVIREDNVNWTDHRISDTWYSQFNPNAEQYDSRALRFIGYKGKRLLNNELRINVTFGGAFDDSLALDLGGDGTIDWAVTQGDGHNTPGLKGGGYKPWEDASPMKMSVKVGQSGTRAVASYKGHRIYPGWAGRPRAGSDLGGGFEWVWYKSLQDLGFNADGSIPSDDFTMKPIRIGTLNDSGAGGHGLSFEITPEFGDSEWEGIIDQTPQELDPITFKYRVNDGNDGEGEASVTFRENRRPLPDPDHISVAPGETSSVDLLTNDSDPDGDSLLITHIHDGDKWVAITNGSTLSIAQGEGKLIGSEFSFTASSTLSPIDVSEVEVIRADNIPWSDPRISDTNYYGTDKERYDTRTLKFVGMKGRRLKGGVLKFSVDFAGTFDDSVAMDLDGDGGIDYAVTQGDAHTTEGLKGGGYAPWKDAGPMKFEVEVGLEETSVVASYNGIRIFPGNAGPTESGGNLGGGFDWARYMNLKTLGFNADGTIPSDEFTMKGIRVGNLNDSGSSHHGMSFEIESGSESFVEPTILKYRVSDGKGGTAEAEISIKI